MLIQPVSRNFLIEVANASEFAEHVAVKTLVLKLIKAGRHGDATQDEIEEHDKLFNQLFGE